MNAASDKLMLLADKVLRIERAQGLSPYATNDDVTEAPVVFRKSGRRPPFIKLLKDFKNGRIYVGNDAWAQTRERIKVGQHVTLLPPEDYPGDYDWGFVAGKVPLVVLTAGYDTQDVRALIALLLAFGARAVVTIGDGRGPQTWRAQ